MFISHYETESQYYINENALEYTDYNCNIYDCGTERSLPGKSYGPTVRDFFTIFYIHSGSGVCNITGVDHYLTTGQGILIPPTTVVFTKADVEDPWRYSWFSFVGLKAEQYLKAAGLTAEKPVFEFQTNTTMDFCFTQMQQVKDLMWGRPAYLTGLFYLLLSQLLETKPRNPLDVVENKKAFYVQRALDYITKNYARKIKIEDIAHHVNLNRRYLCSLFRNNLNSSLQDYLVKYRLNKACELMNNENLSIGDISRSVGYEDPVLFSIVFKKIKGFSPREFRKSHHIPVSGNLPPLWNNRDIGPLAAGGYAEYAGEVFTLHGSGWDIWAGMDEFHFVYRPVDGDCTLVARIISIRNTHPWAKAGIMIREDLDSRSRYAHGFMTPGNGVNFEGRFNPGIHAVVFGRDHGVSIPTYIKIERCGILFRAFYSDNGQDWAPLVNPIPITMKRNVYMGLTLTSHVEGLLSTASFEHVQMKMEK